MIPGLLLAATIATAGDFDTRVVAGLEALKAGSFPKAELNLRKATTLNPDNADVHAAFAVVLALNNQRAEAMKEYKEALRLDRRWVEKRTLAKALPERGWLKAAPATWDRELQNLSLEVFNQPQGAKTVSTEAKLKFPEGWIVDGGSARPNEFGSHATMNVTGGPDAFHAYDAEDWFARARDAEPSRYADFKVVSQETFERDGASGLRVEYTRRTPRYREPLRSLEVILLKKGRFRRAVYEAPLSFFGRHSVTAQKSFDTLEP